MCVLDYVNFFLQNWGDYADMTQGVAIYLLFSSDVLLICWFGTQLTKNVRKNVLLLFLLTLLQHQFHNIDDASNKLRNYTPV
jgi:hypothetical protein